MRMTIDRADQARRSGGASRRGNWTGRLSTRLSITAAIVFRHWLASSAQASFNGWTRNQRRDGVAKNDNAHRHLSAQFADHGRTGPLERAYKAIVWGRPKSLRGTIDAALGRSTDRTKTRRQARGLPMMRAKPSPTTKWSSAIMKKRMNVARLHGGMPARDRPHAPVPRPYGPYRSSTYRRSRIWCGFPHEGQPSAGTGQDGSQPVLAPGTPRLFAGCC